MKDKWRIINLKLLKKEKEYSLKKMEMKLIFKLRT